MYVTYDVSTCTHWIRTRQRMFKLVKNYVIVNMHFLRNELTVYVTYEELWMMCKIWRHRFTSLTRIRVSLTRCLCKRTCVTYEELWMICKIWRHRFTSLTLIRVSLIRCPYKRTCTLCWRSRLYMVNSNFRTRNGRC